jgi:hypothetical protein
VDIKVNCGVTKRNPVSDTGGDRCKIAIDKKTAHWE